MLRRRARLAARYVRRRSPWCTARCSCRSTPRPRPASTWRRSCSSRCSTILRTPARAASDAVFAQRDASNASSACMLQLHATARTSLRRHRCALGRLLLGRQLDVRAGATSAHAGQPGDGARRDANRRCDLLRPRRASRVDGVHRRLATAVRNVPSRGRGSERRSAPRPHLCDEPIERSLLLGMGSAALLGSRARATRGYGVQRRMRASRKPTIGSSGTARAVVDVSAAAECHLFLQCGVPERLYRHPPAQLRRRVSYRAQRHAVPGLDCACVSGFVARIGLPDYHGAGW